MKTIPFILFSLLLLLVIGCSPENRLERLLALHPQLMKTDTLRIRDTFLVQPVVADTSFVFAKLRDPVIIDKDRLHIEMQAKNDTIVVHGECKADTVIREKQVPLVRILKVNTGIIESLIARLSWKVILIAALILGVILVYRKIAR
jgi:hypothetical protein